MGQYQADFETFLQHTNEKEVLRQKLTDIIEVNKVTSLLDLGAGNGDLAIPLASAVQRYLAVEPCRAFVERLRANRLEVIEGAYPLEVEGLYDMVLICHVMSRKRESWEPFVSAAWQKVTVGGRVVIVTYRNGEDSWTHLMRDLDLDQQKENQTTYDEMLASLESLGRVSVQQITTSVTTSNIDEMVQALSFVAGNGIPEQTELFLTKKGLLERILREQYASGDSFSFPFQHFFITCLK